jgi:hypothetical protein
MKTRIYVGERLAGKFTCDGKKMTRWEAFKFKTSQYVTRGMYVLTAISIIGWSIYLGSSAVPQKVWADRLVISDVSTDMFNSRIEKLKMNVVNEIKSCESGGRKEADGLIINDTNNKASIGVMQFQVSTVIHYSKTLHNTVLTPKEAILLALDEDKATQLARDVMFTSKNKANDWLNCATKFDSNRKIDLIKQLEN